MAKYKHKKLGEIITVVHFDGKLGSLKELKEEFFPDAKFIGYDASMGICVDDEFFPIVAGNSVRLLESLYDGQGKVLGIVNMDNLEKNYTPLNNNPKDAHSSDVNNVTMSTIDQVESFTADIWKVIERYMDEFDLPLAGAVGVLEVIKHELLSGGYEADS